jgi:hypothetical protein
MINTREEGVRGEIDLELVRQLSTRHPPLRSSLQRKPQMLCLPKLAHTSTPPQKHKHPNPLTSRILRKAGSHLSTPSFARSHAASLSILSCARCASGASSVFFFLPASASTAVDVCRVVGARRSSRLNFVQEWALNSDSGPCEVFSWRRLRLEGFAFGGGV